MIVIVNIECNDAEFCLVQCIFGRAAAVTSGQEMMCALAKSGCCLKPQQIDSVSPQGIKLIDVF